MKKYIAIILALGLIIFTSCDPKTFDPVLVVSNIQSATITAPATGTALILTEAEADKTITFDWDVADYGYQAAISYSLEMAPAGTDFADPVSLVTTTGTSATFTYGGLNAALLAAQIPDGVATNIEFRVTSDISDEVAEVASEVIDLPITPYKTDVDFPILAVPGSYQGWNPNDSATAVYDREFINSFEGYLYFDGTGVEFKFADVSLGWAMNWGDEDSDGILEENPGGGNIPAPGEGMHRLNVNLDDLSYTVVTTNWGLLGTSTPGNFDTDIDMVYNASTGNLELTTDLTVGEIKFRANDDWAINFGDNNANGSLEYGGDNIVINEAGNYTIELIITGPNYTYTITKN